MGHWLVEANARSGALWGFLVEGHGLSRPRVVAQLRALGTAIEISGQAVDVRDLDLSSVRIRHDVTKRDPECVRFSLEGKAAPSSRRIGATPLSNPGGLTRVQS
jgi:hypothetical protein